MSRRVVVTGLGAISGVGQDIPTFWQGLTTGRSAITHWKNKDKRLESRIGGDLSDFSLDAHFESVGARYPEPLITFAKKLLRQTPLAGRMTAAVALQAWVDAGMHQSKLKAERIGHVCAGHNVNTPYLIENARTFVDDPEFIEPLFGMMCLDTDVVTVTSELLNLKGANLLVGGACASGNLAVISALDLIRAGRLDAVVVTGAPIAMEDVALHGWTMIDALAARSFNDQPARASRPFDVRREGFVPSEASAAVVLESLSHAKKRGAVVRAEILGGAAASDANRLTKPHLDGQVRAMLATLKDARIDASRVDYVNAHATSTPLGDAIEVSAIKQVLGARAKHVPVNATKSMTGHPLTSAGTLELVAAVLQMQHGILHPTINLDEQDPALDLDFVPNVAREQSITCTLSNSFGFGGINSCIAVGPPP